MTLVRRLQSKTAFNTSRLTREPEQHRKRKIKLLATEAASFYLERCRTDKFIQQKN